MVALLVSCPRDDVGRVGGGLKPGKAFTQGPRCSIGAVLPSVPR